MFPNILNSIDQMAVCQGVVVCTKYSLQREGRGCNRGSNCKSENQKGMLLIFYAQSSKQFRKSCVDRIFI